MEKPVIEQHGKIAVVRDDLYAGGTKARVLTKLLASHPANEFIYPAVADGHGGLALACAAKALGKKATLVMARRHEKNFTPLMRQILEQGATIEFVDFPNFFHQFIIPRAEALAKERPNAECLPAGFNGLAGMQDALADIATSTGLHPSEVWSVGGSGTLTNALQQAWPEAKFYVVDVVRNGKADFGRATVIESPLKFSERVKPAHRPPFDSVTNYDAKAWEFIEAHASEGAVFWNVAGDVEPTPNLAPPRR